MDKKKEEYLPISYIDKEEYVPISYIDSDFNKRFIGIEKVSPIKLDHIDETKIPKKSTNSDKKTKIFVGTWKTDYEEKRNKFFSEYVDFFGKPPSLRSLGRQETDYEIGSLIH